MYSEAAKFQEIRVVSPKYPKVTRFACRYICPCSQVIILRQSLKYPLSTLDCPRCSLTVTCDIPHITLELLR